MHSCPAFRTKSWAPGWVVADLYAALSAEKRTVGGSSAVLEDIYIYIYIYSNTAHYKLVSIV